MFFRKSENLNKNNGEDECRYWYSWKTGGREYFFKNEKNSGILKTFISVRIIEENGVEF